jgi:hypothetical protein
MSPLEGPLSGVLRDAVASVGLLALPLGVALWVLAPGLATLRASHVARQARGRSRRDTEGAGGPASYRLGPPGPGAERPTGPLEAVGLLSLWSGQVGVVWLPVTVAVLPFSWAALAVATLGAAVFAAMAARGEALLRSRRPRAPEALAGAAALLAFCLLASPFALAAGAPALAVPRLPLLPLALLGGAMASLVLGGLSTLAALVLVCFHQEAIPGGSSPPAPSRAPARARRLLALGLLVLGSSVAYRTQLVDRELYPREDRPRVVLRGR